jgi:predicted RNA-binding protein YlxR (DUF448 family)
MADKRDKSWLELAQQEIKRLTPARGFNVVAVDAYEMPGEGLYLVKHCETEEEAKKVAVAHEKKSKDKTYVYSPEGQVESANPDGRVESKVPDLIPGGKSAGKPLSKYDPAELHLGMKVESEHTDDWAIALEIVCDHLEEDAHYYTVTLAKHIADEEAKDE